MNLPANMQNKDLRTLGYVLRRVNYGEADRILNIITSSGKFSVMAKGVRKSKSKLAGGIEMFTLSEFNIHFGKGEFGVLTGAKMMRYYDEIIKDFGRMELGGTILKKVSLVADSSDNPEYFRIVDESLRGLNGGGDLRLIEAWFLINLVKAMGEEVNLYRDAEGLKLEAEKKYSWNEFEKVFYEDEGGKYGVDEIKMLRLMLTNDFTIVKRVKVGDEMIGLILRVAKTVANML